MVNSKSRVTADLENINTIDILQDHKTPGEITKNLYANLTLPSYVHGYSLAIEYIYNWFKSKFDKDFFKGGIYVDGKHVLDDYKKFSKDAVIKRLNPKARIAPSVDYDYDRESIDFYQASPEIFIRRSNFNESFFKDYDRDMFLNMHLRALQMNFSFKVRVNSRAEQLDLFNRMELYFRVGATQAENISADFHVPKSIILNIANRAGFEISNGEVVDIIEFINYLNSHSDLPFLFKLRAINQKPEYFIRLNGLYTHIGIKDKLQLDDGERDGKLDYNFHIEMNAVLTIPIPHFYIFYSATDLMTQIDLHEMSKDAVAIYSLNILEIPKVDENGWYQAAITDYMADKGDIVMDLSSIFSGDNILSRAINHDLTNGISPSRFINIKVYRNEDTAKICPITMDWNTKIAEFKDGPVKNEEVFHIAVYYDRAYINELEISSKNFNDNRLSKA